MPYQEGIAFSNINVTIESNNIHLSKFLHHTGNKSFNTMFSICRSFFCTSTINISFYITFFLFLYGSNGSGSSGSGSSSTGAVKSGVETTIVFVMAGLMVSAAGVMFLARKKKED